MKQMFMHDTRAIGDAPPWIPPDDNYYKVDGGVTLGNAFLWVKNYAKSQCGLSTLVLMCHGLGGAEDNKQLEQCTTVGGYGLYLCKENLTLNTMKIATDKIKGLIDNIVVLACSAAAMVSNNAGHSAPGDGEYFCASLAHSSGAKVYAADQDQPYNPQIFSGGVLDFSGWRGKVSLFTPKGDVIPVANNG